MGDVVRYGTEWWGYGKTRMLGPFKFETQAWKALKKEDEL